MFHRRVLTAKGIRTASMYRDNAYGTNAELSLSPKPDRHSRSLNRSHAAPTIDNCINLNRKRQFSVNSSVMILWKPDGRVYVA